MKKNALKLIGFIAFAAVIGLFVTACTLTEVYAVGFNSNGGTAVGSLKINSGSKITKPTDPTKEPATYYELAGWYKDPEFNSEWDFSTDTVTSAITLYAKWRPKMAVGATGPGNGKIFFVANYEVYANGIKLYTGTTASDNSYTLVWYFEAAPADISGTKPWGTVSTNIPATEAGSGVMDYGRGKRNTALILATDSGATAARACREYSNNGKTDWFLPGRGELGLLYDNRTAAGITLSGDYYWSSTQNSNSNAVMLNATADYFEAKTTAHYVRPIRAF